MTSSTDKKKTTNISLPAATNETRNNSDSDDEAKEVPIDIVGAKIATQKKSSKSIDIGFVEEGLEDGWQVWDGGKCGGRPIFLVINTYSHNFDNNQRPNAILPVMSSFIICWVSDM